MKRFILTLLAVLALTAVCTPCAYAYDIASEQRRHSARRRWSPRSRRRHMMPSAR